MRGLLRWPILECTHSHSHTGFIPLDGVNQTCKIRNEDTAYLYTNRNMREDPQVYLGTLDRLNFTLDDFLCSRELFSSEADTFALDANAPVSIFKCGPFDESASGDWNDTRVSFDESYSSFVAQVDALHSVAQTVVVRVVRRRAKRERSHGLCNHRALAFSRTLVPLVLIPQHSRSYVLLHSSLATMSDRKRALEDGGSSVASKKARRSVFMLLNASFLVLTRSFNSETTVSTFLPPVQGEYGCQYPLLTCFYNLFTPQTSSNGPDSIGNVRLCFFICVR